MPPRIDRQTQSDRQIVRQIDFIRIMQSGNIGSGTESGTRLNPGRFPCNVRRKLEFAVGLVGFRGIGKPLHTALAKTMSAGVAALERIKKRHAFELRQQGFVRRELTSFVQPAARDIFPAVIGHGLDGVILDRVRAGIAQLRRQVAVVRVALAQDRIDGMVLVVISLGKHILITEFEHFRQIRIGGSRPMHVIDAVLIVVRYAEKCAAAPAEH